MYVNLCVLTRLTLPNVEHYMKLIVSVVCVCVFCLCLHHTGPVDMSIQAKCDPCLSNPCKNDGTCSNDPVHYYRCTCPYGFKVRILWKAKTVVFTCKYCDYKKLLFFENTKCLCVFAFRDRTVRSPFMPVSVTRA